MEEEEEEEEPSSPCVDEELERTDESGETKAASSVFGRSRGGEERTRRRGGGGWEGGGEGDRAGETVADGAVETVASTRRRKGLAGMFVDAVEEEEEGEEEREEEEEEGPLRTGWREWTEERIGSRESRGIDNLTPVILILVLLSVVIWSNHGLLSTLFLRI